MLNIGDMYMNGTAVPKNPAGAAGWYMKAAARGNGLAQCRLGRMMLEGNGMAKDAAGAIRMLERAAHYGDTCSMNLLASIYADGAGFRRNPDKALKLRLEAANRGDDQAQYELSQAYGSGVTKSGKDFLYWLVKSASGGHPLAMERLAEVYRHGQFGLPANPAKANAWQQMAGTAKRERERGRRDRIMDQTILTMR